MITTKFLFFSKIIQGLMAIIGFIVLVFGVMEFFFKQNDIQVMYTFNDADLPTSIVNKYIDILDPLNKIISQKNDTVKNNIVELTNYFRNTRDKVRFEIINNSDKTIKNIDIRIKNVINLTAWGVTGNALQSTESTEIMRKMRNDKSTGIVTFSGIEKLSPQSTLIINFWGEISYSSLEDPIVVLYDGGVGKTLKSSVVTGFDSFIYENSEFLLLVLVLINLGLFLFLFERLCKRQRSNLDKSINI